MEQLFTIQEAADYLRVKRSTLYKYMDRGVFSVKLGYIYVGGERRITRGAIERFIAESTARGIASGDTIEDEILMPELTEAEPLTA